MGYILSSGGVSSSEKYPKITLNVNEFLRRSANVSHSENGSQPELRGFWRTRSSKSVVPRKVFTLTNQATEVLSKWQMARKQIPRFCTPNPVTPSMTSPNIEKSSSN